MMNKKQLYPNVRSKLQIKAFLGNKELLKLDKIAFLSSRKISSKAVLKCYDWAIVQREMGNCVISGFHSQIEKDVFEYLAKGSQPIILALPRGLNKRWTPRIKELLHTDRFLIITPFSKSVTRITKDTSEVRNRLMLQMADEIVIGYKYCDSSLDKVISEMAVAKKVKFLST